MADVSRPKGYQVGTPPTIPGGEALYLQGELRKIAMTLDALVALCPQEANMAPANPRLGMQRYAVDPWASGMSLPSGSWVYFSVTGWKPL